MEKNYKYYNRNPDKLHIEDCVCRAISTATGLKYEAVNNLLSLTAKNYECDKLCVWCYHNLLDNVLLYDYRYCINNETVSDIANDFPNNNVIIRIKNHLTTSIKGTILDIWDCSNELVDCFWVIR